MDRKSLNCSFLYFYKRFANAVVTVCPVVDLLLLSQGAFTKYKPELIYNCPISNSCR